MQKKFIHDEIENALIWAKVDVLSILDKYINQQTLNNIHGLSSYIRCYEVLNKVLAENFNTQIYTANQMSQIMQELGIKNDAVFAEMFLSNPVLTQFNVCQFNASNQANISAAIKQNLKDGQQDLAVYFCKILQQNNWKANNNAIAQQLRLERRKLLEPFIKDKNNPLYLEKLASKNSAVQEKFLDYLLNALEIGSLFTPAAAENTPYDLNPQIFPKTTFTTDGLKNTFGEDAYAVLEDADVLSYLFKNSSAADAPEQLTPQPSADTGGIFNANNHRYRYTVHRQWKLQQLLENTRKTFNELLRQKQAEDQAEAILRELLYKAYDLKQQILAGQGESTG
jgi:hypothetical protein